MNRRLKRRHLVSPLDPRKRWKDPFVLGGNCLSLLDHTSPDSSWAVNTHQELILRVNKELLPIFFRLITVEIWPPLFRWAVTLKSNIGFRCLEWMVFPKPSTHFSSPSHLKLWTQEQNLVSAAESPVSPVNVSPAQTDVRFTRPSFSRCRQLHHLHHPHCRSALQPAGRSHCCCPSWCGRCSWVWALRRRGSLSLTCHPPVILPSAHHQSFCHTWIPFLNK